MLFLSDGHIQLGFALRFNYPSLRFHWHDDTAFQAPKLLLSHVTVTLKRSSLILSTSRLYFCLKVLVLCHSNPDSTHMHLVLWLLPLLVRLVCWSDWYLFF